MAIPAFLTDTLAAVNVMLSTIGEAPINDIEESQSVDAANALTVLNEVQLAVLNKGWAFNTEERFTLSRNVSDEIPLPNMALKVANAKWPDGTLASRAVERARKLYNAEDHTYIWDQNVLVDLVVYLEFEEMPEAAKRYITIRAAKQFQGRYQNDSMVDRITDDEVALALTTLEQAEDEQRAYNSVTGNTDVVGRIDGRGTRRRRNS